jgi:hypothetical protein
MDDLLNAEGRMQRRLFGPRTPPAPTNRPGLENRGNFRAIVEGRNEMPPQGDGLLSPQDKARAALLMQHLAAFIQNVNITVSQPAHNEPNLWSTPIDLSGQVIIPAAAGAWVNVLSYRVQPGRWARITGYGVDVSSPANFTYDGSLLWRVQKNGLDVETLANWGEHRGSVIRPRETFLLGSGDVGDGEVITFDVQRAVAAALPATVQMALVGYTWRPRNNYEGTKAGTTAY